MPKYIPKPELIVKNIDKFEKKIKSFENKASKCNLNGIKRDIIEIEYISRDLDIYIKSPKLEPRQFSRYNMLSNKYDDSIKILENECKCKRVK